jgi:hypothetical protein
MSSRSRVADRKHPVPPDRPQDHLGGELPAFEGLIPRYLDRLSTLGHPTASTRQGRRRKAATEPPRIQRDTIQTVRLIASVDQVRASYPEVGRGTPVPGGFSNSAPLIGLMTTSK